MDEILEIKTLMQAGNFARAQDVARQMTAHGKAIPAEAQIVEGLYFQAVCARYLKDYKTAKNLLVQLQSRAPEFGRCLQELGHLARDQNRLTDALVAYRQAVQANPGLKSAWLAQAMVMQKQGNAQGARQAKMQADRLSALPPALFAATNFIYENKVVKAEKLVRKFLQQNPKNIEGMRLLAEIASRFGVVDEADFLLESAIEFSPENLQLRIDYIQILRRRQKFEAALEQAKIVHTRDPENPVFQSYLAIENMQTGNHEEAFELFHQVIRRLPNDFATLTSLGHAYKTVGDYDKAVESYRSAFEKKPDHGDAYFGLANLKTYNFSDAEFAQMKDLVDQENIGFMDRVNLRFALGKSYEDQKDFQNAFKQYQLGNDLKRTHSAYETEEMTRELETQSEICTRDLIEKQGGQGCEAPDPIFIVGLPRAGSTLLEQILASHGQIDGTLELPNILSISFQLRGRGRKKSDGLYPKILHDLPADKLLALGQKYIDETRIHRKDAPFFIDKMPNNFRHIGLIKLILPNAKIIDARRHPMACCFSGFKQLFAEGQEFTYGLKQVGTYYKDYVALMDHWDSIFPDQILRVQYEDVVADVEGQVRRILNYLGLPFEDNCVEFHKTERSVRTASSEQVRQPIFKSGLEQWRHFEPWLDPLKVALGPEILKRYPI